MRKALILRDERSGEYFTNDYDRWWSRDIRHAYRVADYNQLDYLIEVRLRDEFKSGLEDVEFMEVVTIYTK